MYINGHYVQLSIHKVDTAFRACVKYLLMKTRKSFAFIRMDKEAGDSHEAQEELFACDATSAVNPGQTDPDWAHGAWNDGTGAG